MTDGDLYDWFDVVSDCIDQRELDGLFDREQVAAAFEELLRLMGWSEAWCFHEMIRGQLRRGSF